MCSPRKACRLAPGLAWALFCRSIPFIPFFLLMHISSRTSGRQFPCNSVQDVHTYWEIKHALQTRKINVVLVQDWLCVIAIYYSLWFTPYMIYQVIHSAQLLMLFLCLHFPLKLRIFLFFICKQCFPPYIFWLCTCICTIRFRLWF